MLPRFRTRLIALLALCITLLYSGVALAKECDGESWVCQVDTITWVTVRTIGEKVPEELENTSRLESKLRLFIKQELPWLEHQYKSPWEVFTDKYEEATESLKMFFAFYGPNSLQPESNRHLGGVDCALFPITSQSILAAHLDCKVYSLGQWAKTITIGGNESEVKLGGSIDSQMMIMNSRNDTHENVEKAMKRLISDIGAQLLERIARINNTN